MPLRRVKSRVLFQNLTKKPKKDIYHSARGKSTRIAIGGAPERVLTMSPVRKEPEYPKIRVPSKDELQDLHSKMSATIAAAKARGAQQRSCNAPSPPSRLHLERLPDEMQNSKVAFTEPTASASVSERVPATSTPATRKGTAYEDDDEPSASLLATTAVYRPIEYPIAPAILDGQAADGPHDTPSVDATDVAAIRELSTTVPQNKFVALRSQRWWCAHQSLLFALGSIYRRSLSGYSHCSLGAVDVAITTSSCQVTHLSLHESRLT